MTAALLSGQGPAKPAVDVLVAEDEAATKVLLALHRLAAQSTLYAEDNEAQRRALQATASAAADYGRTTGRNITIFFSDRAVYVGRRLLRANRPVYGAADQLRNLLALMGGSQITIGFDVPLDDLRSLQEVFATAMREKRAATAPAGLSRIRLRVGRPPGELSEFDGLPQEDRALKIYTLAIVIVRRFFEQLQRGSFELPGHLRRIGQQLIQLAESSSPAFGAIAKPTYVDLSGEGDGQPPPHVVRVVASVDDDQARAATERFDQMPDEALGTDGAAVPKEERPTAKPGRGGAAAPAVHVPPAPKIDSLIELADRDDDIHILLGPTDEAAGATALRSIPPPPPGPLSDLPPSALQPGLVPGVEQPSLIPRAPASAQGTLAKTPLVHLLVYVLDNKLTGTLLMVAPERGRSAIYVHGGRPCKARTPEMVSPIGETLLGMGVLDEATLTQSLQAASRLQVLHGQHLLSRGVIDQEVLQAALQQQLVNKIGYMLRLAPTTR